ncbi:MAG TPA: SCO family protein [Thermoanaerobaculia bacterium]|nr:SCO family protein [Thermoanaerobaculia bacterium]
MFALALALLLGASTVPAVDRQPIARVAFFDDRGQTRSTEEWRGLPSIIAPVYTRCPVACPLITAGVRKALAESSARPGTYRVVLFSFDPRDTPADLRRFRERHNVPIDWTVASAKEPDIRALMDSLGFRYAQTNNAFTHPNMIFAVTPDLKTAKALIGTEYRAEDIDEMLAVARGGSDWLDRYAGMLMALLLFACTASAAWLAMLAPRVRRA